jgi:primosomal protein N' (replication factor Y)
LKLAIYTALFICMPVILYQLWAFVRPGLYKKEKRLARPLLIATVVLVYLGCAFAYFLVLLQTHHPQHPLLRDLLAHGYAATARKLLAERRTIQLPPYSYQALLRADAVQRAQVDVFLAAALAALPATDGLQSSGPMPAPMPLRAGRQRGQLLLEATQRSVLRAVLRPWWLALRTLPSARRVRWSLDVDPIDLY